MERAYIEQLIAKKQHVIAVVFAMWKCSQDSKSDAYLRELDSDLAQLKLQLKSLTRED